MFMFKNVTRFFKLCVWLKISKKREKKNHGIVGPINENIVPRRQLSRVRRSCFPTYRRVILPEHPKLLLRGHGHIQPPLPPLRSAAAVRIPPILYYRQQGEGEEERWCCREEPKVEPRILSNSTTKVESRLWRAACGVRRSKRGFL